MSRLCDGRAKGDTHEATRMGIFGNGIPHYSEKHTRLPPERDGSGGGAGWGVVGCGGVRLGASSSADFKRYRGPFCLPPPGNKRMLKKGCYCKKDVIVKRST